MITSKRKWFIGLGFIGLTSAVLFSLYSDVLERNIEPLVLTNLTEKELVETFAKKEPIPSEVEGQASESLFTQLKSEQKEFDAEGHGYFVVQGDSMTPNLYDGDTVRLVSNSYTDGDYVALTIHATGEHLVKQFVDGELVSSNASGGYYQLEDVTIHGKVEQVKDVALEVNQTLQAATGIYVVDVVVNTHGSSNSVHTVYTLLSNGQVFARALADPYALQYGDERNKDYYYWRNTGTGNASSDPARWHLSGTSIPIPANITPVSITSQSHGTDRGVSVLYVLLSNGSVYARAVAEPYAPQHGDERNKDYYYWRSTGTGNANSDPARWHLSGTSIPQALVSPPNSGSLSVPQSRLVGRASSGAGDAEYLTAGQTKQLLESTDLLFYPVGTTAASVGMVEIKSIDATTKFWQSNYGGVPIHHTVKLYTLPTSAGDISIR